MPDTEKEYGRAISADDTRPIIECRRNFAITQSVIHEGIYNRLPDSPFKTYCKSDFNCFVFKKDLITRFFPEVGGAEYLMVILGAHDKEDGVFTAGTPTVIVAGCNLTATKENGEKDYETLNDPFPANEHPPGTGIINFPPAGSGGKILLTVKKEELHL